LACNPELLGDRLQRPAALLEKPHGFGLELAREPASRPRHLSISSRLGQVELSDPSIPPGEAHFSEPGLIARCVNGCFAIGRHRSRRNMRCRRCGGKVLYAPAAGG
jgi:hypothetical protein